MKLLVIEDDRFTAEFIKNGLEEDGHHVDHTVTGRVGLEYLRTDRYDALILDLNLPDTNGLTITETLRAEGLFVPILMLTGAARTEYVVQCLDAGADDYLTKPFAMDELRARIRAITRRGPGQRTEEVQLGALKMNRLTHEVILDGQPVKLTPKEYRLLEYFLVRPQQLISRGELLEKVWESDSDQHSNIVDAHVARLRAKLGRVNGAPQIETARGFGYVLKHPTG